MNRQEALDRAAEHLLVTQRCPAWADNACHYWTPSGARCAVGALLSREVAQNLASAGFGVVTGILNVAEVARRRTTINDYQRIAIAASDELDGLSAEFLWHLQRVHDAPACDDVDPLTFRIRVRERLETFAETFRLKLPACVHGSEP